LRRHYDGVDLTVTPAGETDNGALARHGAGTMLQLSALDPDPLSVGDLQHVGSMNLAHTPLGLRLVQIETHHEPSRVERLAARIDAFNAAAWGQPLLDPYWVVSCAVSLEDIEIPAVRFVCDPTLPAAEGTERVQ